MTPAQSILWHPPDTGEVLGRLREKMVSLHHHWVWHPEGLLGLFLSLSPQDMGRCCITTQVTRWFHSPVGNKLVPVRSVMESHPQQLAEAHVSPQIPS